MNTLPYSTSYRYKIVDDKAILVEYISQLYDYNKCTRLYDGQFASFYKLISAVVTFDKTIHIKQFFECVLPWKLQHPRTGNNKELCEVLFPDNVDAQHIVYNKMMLSKNPWYDKHDSSRSPFSMSYVKYEGMTDEEKKQKIREICQFNNKARQPNQKLYWINRGLSEEDAVKKARSYINVFSLESCIHKYGEKEGYRRFVQRQIKWQTTLTSKPIEEQLRINHAKVYKHGSRSSIESVFLNQISNDESTHNVYLKDLRVIVDLIVGRKIIEFYGDYWHCNPKLARFSDGTMYHPYLKMTAAEKWEFDANRVNKLINAGYDVKVVWESDYRSNETSIIEECKEFIYEK